jgi:hypothetical protein
MRPIAIGTWLFGFVLLVGGCHKFFTDYRLEESGSVDCARGAVQCVGNVLQGCSADGASWVNLSVCASETLCDKTQGVCLPATCAAGERRCDGADLQVCSATRDGWALLQHCASAARCSAESGSCTDQPCMPGMLQCNGNLLQSCKDDQSGWNDLFTCESSALCNKAAGSCDDAKCQVGTFNCDGAQLQACNDTRSGWTPVRTCETEALCDEVNGSCGAVACTTAGAFRCTDAGALERCADDLTGWAPLAMCQSGAYCDAINGACSEMPCQPGAHQCSGDTLVECKADRSGWSALDECDSEALCQQTLSAGLTACVAPSCEAGATRCVDGQPQICNAGRTDFRANGDACATVELCNGGTATCATPVCAPSDRHCVGAQPETCNPGRTEFVDDGAPCASVALCNLTTGTCGEQKCVAGQLRCDPANPTHLQRCTADLTGWESEPCDICATAELCSASLAAATCDATSCKEPVCTAGEPRCAGGGTDQGKVLEMCNSGRTGYTSCQTCATSGLCDLSLKTKPFACTATACTAPSCALTDRWCGGTDNKELYQCPASRINSQATKLDTCETPRLCQLAHDQGKTTCVEPSCNLTDLWCAGAGNKTLYKCPASRVNSEATALGACLSNGLCELSRQQGKTTCEAPKCAVGGTQCGGTGTKTLQMCNSERTGFTDCDTCSTAQLCTDSLGAATCDASACATCSPSEARCNASGNYETCKPDLTGFTVTDCLGNGCDDQSGCLEPATGGAGP